jgi:hypothetical protein
MSSVNIPVCVNLEIIHLTITSPFFVSGCFLESYIMNSGVSHNVVENPRGVKYL